MRAPFGTRLAALYAIAGPVFAFIALYRAAPYRFPEGVWALSLSLGLLGVIAPLVLSGRVRDRMLSGRLPLALVIPAIGTLVSSGLVPSSLTVGPCLFCAGALVGAAGVACVNARHPGTARDVAPLESKHPVLAARLVAGTGILLVASVLLSTATAQPPLDDARHLPVLTGSRAESHVEPRLSDALSALAGHRAEARCWSPADWRRLSRQRSTWPRHERRLGRWSAYASPAHDQAHLSATLCAVLSRLTYGRTPVRNDVWPAALAVSVATLAHEAQHLRGIFNEAKAECYGMQSIARTAELLGRNADEGQYLAFLYWRYSYNDEDRDRAYFSEDCRNGGRLDLHPTGVWP